MSWVAAAIGGSALLGYMGAQSAADKQLAGVQAGTEAQKAMFDIQNEQQKPYREAGYTALSDIAGMRPYLQHQFTPEDFAAGIDPGYAFRLQQGQMANQRAANVGGGALSGNTLKGLQDYTQGEASQEFGNAFNRYQTQRSNIYNTLASIAGLGQTSLGQTTQAGTQTGANLAALNVAGGNAAAGGIGAATGALTGGLNTAGQYGFLRSLQQGNQTPQGYGQPVQQPIDINLA